MSNSATQGSNANVTLNKSNDLALRPMGRPRVKTKPKPSAPRGRPPKHVDVPSKPQESLL